MFLSVEAAAMARKAIQNDFLIPTEATMDLWRQRLSHFSPYKTKELLADAQALKNETATLDDAISIALHKRKQIQVAKLLTELGFDSSNKDIWRDAFIKLAEIHHNVGRLLVQSFNKQISQGAWSQHDEAKLLREVFVLLNREHTQRSAIRIIADSGRLPYQERMPGQRINRRAARDANQDWRSTQDARRDALWQQYQRIRKKSEKTDHLSRVFANDMSVFEALIWRESPIGKAFLAGNKRPSKKSPV
jgi:hypothetical protein